MIDLNPNHLETVKRILAEHVPGCEVAVGDEGSRCLACSPSTTTSSQTGWWTRSWGKYRRGGR